jgi:hypothetical protein
MIGVVGNKVEFFRVVGNNEKNVRRCGQQRGRIARTQNSKTFIL